MAARTLRTLTISMAIFLLTSIAALLAVRFIYPAYGYMVDYGWATLNLAMTALCGYAWYRSRATQRELEQRYKYSPYIDVDLAAARQFVRRMHFWLVLAAAWNLVWGVLNVFHFFGN